MKTYLKIPIALVMIGMASCHAKPDNPGAGATMDSSMGMQQEVPPEVYTCPMHHQIRSDKPGQCPICGMTLVPMGSSKTVTGSAVPLIRIPPREQMLAGIRTDTARLAPWSGELVLTGTTLFDPRNTTVVSARVSGWIKKMYVRNPGERVEIGQKLYDLYSPDLLSVEKEYLLALQRQDSLGEASRDLAATRQAFRQKLLRWGLSADQINQLPLSSDVAGYIRVYSPWEGIVAQRVKQPGDYVEEGDAILNLVKNKTLWVEAQLYDDELGLLFLHPRIWIKPEAFPKQKLRGTLMVENPVIETDSRVHLLHIAIPNPEGIIQPGMLADVYLQTSSGNSTLVVPKSAIIYDEKNNYVWLERPDSSFERREVLIGQENRTMVQILKGMKPGEVVVSSGAYLVNSEYILENGGVNLSGMQMPDMKMSGGQ